MSDVASIPDPTGLHRVAYSQDGYFTTAQGREHGYSPQLLAHHVRSGRYERARRGLYRLRDFPSSPHEEVRVAWLMVGPDRAVVSHESALELQDLSDVLPDLVHLLVQRSDRGIRRPNGVVLHTSTMPLAPGEVVTKDGMRVTGPTRSILDAAAAGTAPEQIERAIAQAIREGRTTRRELAEKARERSARVQTLVRNAVRGAA